MGVGRDLKEEEGEYKDLERQGQKQKREEFRMNMFRKAGIVAALAAMISTTAWANAAYSVVDAGYSQGMIGTITSTDGRVQQNAVNQLPGAPAVHAFTDANGQTRVLAYNYSYSAVKPELVVYNPATPAWTPIKSFDKFAGENITNLYGIATIGNFMYAIDYDKATITKINMANNAYDVQSTYKFSATAGYDPHGMAIVAVGNDLYALFAEVKDPWNTADYLPSKVVKLNKDTLMPVGMPVPVGKNAFTLKHYNNKLYVVSLGGKQLTDAYNNGQSKIDVINLANMSVRTAMVAGGAVPYDFRDIAIGNNGVAYILAGKYINNYGSMQGGVYKTTATALENGSAGQPFNFNNTSGFCWALHYENATDRLWIAKGNQIDLHQGSDYRLIRDNMYVKTILANGTYENLNSITLIGQGVTLQGYQDPRMASGQAKMRAIKRIQQ